MFRLLYTLGIAAYALGIWLAAPFHTKARMAVVGRRRQRSQWMNWRSNRSTGGGRVVWFHCASLGEFEQGRPLIEALRNRQPDTAIVLTFFSPSGFEVRKNYPFADAVWYLPLDLPGRARRFVEAIRPDTVVFIKYEYWAYYFLALRHRSVPLYVVSAIFRPGQRFFGWQRTFWMPVLAAVHRFHVQNETSAVLLRGAGIHCVEVCGDTRFDRVLAVAAECRELESVAAFAGESPVLVCGSSYAIEERIARDFLSRSAASWKVIIAPHQVDESRVASIQALFGSRVARLSQWQATDAGCRVLVADTMGQLSAIYRYGQMALVGGAFGKGLHNTLEAAAYGIPVAFGTRWEQFDEARMLIQSGGAFAGSPDAVGRQLDLWATDEITRRRAGLAARDVVEGGRGAVEKAMQLILESPSGAAKIS